MRTVDILKIAYKMELQGMDFYKTQGDKVKQPVVKEAFQHLEKMELEHAEYLKNQISNIEKNLPLDKLPDSEDNKFTERMKKQLIEVKKLDSDLGDYSIIRMAYLIEKDFAEFYEKSAEKNEGDAKKLFLKLSDWEKGHQELMKNQLETIIEKNALDLGFYPL